MPRKCEHFRGTFVLFSPSCDSDGNAQDPKQNTRRQEEKIGVGVDAPGGFPGLLVFVCCQVLGNATKPGEFAGPLRKGLFGGHSPVERVLCDLFRQRLIPHQGHHIRIDLQIVGLI